MQYHQCMEGVESLVDKNLLRQIAQEEDEPRLMMLETIREYGLEMLLTNGEMATARQSHATYYLRISRGGNTKIQMYTGL